MVLATQNRDTPRCSRTIGAPLCWHVFETSDLLSEPLTRISGIPSSSNVRKLPTSATSSSLPAITRPYSRGVLSPKSIELITCIASGGDIGNSGKFAGDPLRENS
ncbi:MAG: hypothetical protein CM15mP49_13670 [Actinomycetota bacterium]|nr:MAG: hypothetical protein CM15mP49_13670 [Actinomycetota bacterium]